jgi:hypothetical protein
MTSSRAARTASPVVCRPTEPDDLAALGALFDDRFGHPVSPEEWQWKYRRLPGEARSWVAVDEGGRVLAHAGALCLPARVRDPATGGVRDAPIWQATDWAGTAAATGLRPPLVRLGQSLFRDLPRAGDAPWIFGFPSDRHFRLGRRVFGYRVLPAVPELAGELPVSGPALAEGLEAAADLAQVAEHCGDWPEEAEAAWEGCGVLGIRRSAAFLNWRYHARPGRYYRFYRLRPSVNGAAQSGAGLAVFAFVGTEALAAELWLPGSGGDGPAEAWLPSLLAVAADLAASGLTGWRFWPFAAPSGGSGASGRAVDLLARLGVRATGEARFMGSRGATGARGRGASPHPADAHFYYAMGDYDLV